MGLRLTQHLSQVRAEEYLAYARYKRQIPAQRLSPGFEF